MKLILATLTLTITAALFAAPAHADEPDPTPGKVLIIGDSITARYNNTMGDPQRGWWSTVAENMGLTPVKAALSSTGMLARGGNCDKTTFGERLPTIATEHPTAIITAGGRNDFRFCRTDGTYRRATPAESQLAIREYMRDLKNAALAEGIPLSNVYAMCPWGTTFADDYDVIEPFVEKWSQYYGLVYVYVGKLNTTYTVDGTHPNTAGNTLLAARVLRGM